MADKQAERIKFETELLRLTVLVGAATGGGTLSLLLGPSTPVRLLLAGAGILGTLVLAMAAWRLVVRIGMAIDQIEETRQ